MPFGRGKKPPRALIVLAVAILLALAFMDLTRHDSLVRSTVHSVFSDQTRQERILNQTGRSRFGRPTRPVSPRR